MSDELTPERVARIVRQQLESLESAGIKWLPKGDPVPLASLFGAPEPPTPTLAPQDLQAERRRALTVLAAEVAQCTRCEHLAATRTQTVFGTGPIDAELCLIGEAPGADEDRLGEPFVGAAGHMLTQILAACGLTRQDVYICNVLKCRPPGNATPGPVEAENCKQHLLRQLELINPKFMCCLGGVAMKLLLNTSTPVSRMRGRLHDFHGVKVVVTYHPAYLLPHRGDAEDLKARKRMVWDDMKFLMEQMGRTIAKK